MESYDVAICAPKTIRCSPVKEDNHFPNRAWRGPCFNSQGGTPPEKQALCSFKTLPTQLVETIFQG